MNQKIGSIDVLLYVAAQNAGQPELDLYNQADDSIVPSKKFMRRMKRLLSRVRREEEWADWMPAINQVRRVAAVIMAVLSISFVMAMSIGAVREAIWKTIVEWYEKKISVVFVSDDAVEVPPEILEYREPTAGLDGFERFEIDRNRGRFCVEYESDSALVTYNQTVITDAGVYLSNNKSELYKIKVSGYEGVYVTYNTQGIDHTVLVWVDGGYEYHLSGNVPIKQMIVIAESVKKIK